MEPEGLLLCSQESAVRMHTFSTFKAQIQ